MKIHPKQFIQTKGGEKKMENLPKKKENFSIKKMSPHKKKRAVKWTVAKWLTIFFVALTVIVVIEYFQNEFFMSHSLKFQTPVLFQQPIVIQKREIVSPMAKAKKETIYINVGQPIDVNQAENLANQVKKKISSGKAVFDVQSQSELAQIPQSTIRDLIKNKVIQMYGIKEWNKIDYLITRESNFQPYVINVSSGACGIFQALPCTKLPSMDITDQINWGINIYIPEHYGSANAAYVSEKTRGWY